MLLLIVLVLCVADCWSIEYEQCETDGESIINIDSFKLSPHPVVIPGEVVASFKGTLLEDVTEKFHISMKIIRLLKLFGEVIELALPCLGNIGSCITPVCNFLKEHEDRICPFFPKHKGCSCPFSAGTYEGFEIGVPMPDFGALVSQIIKGNYKIEIKAIDKEGKVRACVIAHLELTKKEDDEMNDAMIL